MRPTCSKVCAHGRRRPLLSVSIQTMTSLDPRDLDHRLAALCDDLSRFPAGVFCPWPIARVYNRLLEQVKDGREDDPLTTSLSVLKEHSSEHEENVSQALVGTVQALIGQARAVVNTAQNSHPATPDADPIPSTSRPARREPPKRKESSTKAPPRSRAGSVTPASSSGDRPLTSR